MTNTEVAKKEEKPTLAQLIERQKPAIAKALPRHMNPERMARIATTVLRQTPALARTSPESFLGALMTASQLGLEPGPTGEAYFVPYGNVCTFIPGYRGLIKLARNSGMLVDIWAEIVYENDIFKYTLGLHRDLQHQPASGERGEPTHVYAAAALKDGGHPFVVLTIAEVEAIRARSKASKNGPWVTDWAAMARKTAIKQLSKWLPLSAEFNTAAVLDESVRTEVGDLVDVQPNYDVDGEVVEDQPGQGGGDDQGQGAEPSTGADTPADSGDQAPADADAAADAGEVRYAGKAELDKLKAIRQAERHDDASWADFVHASIGRRVKADKDLTLDESRQLIDLFNEDGTK